MTPADYARLDQLTAKVEGGQITAFTLINDGAPFRFPADFPKSAYFCSACERPAPEATTFIEGRPICKDCEPQFISLTAKIRSEIDQKLLVIERPDKSISNRGY